MGQIKNIKLHIVTDIKLLKGDFRLHHPSSIMSHFARTLLGGLCKSLTKTSIVRSSSRCVSSLNTTTTSSTSSCFHERINNNILNHHNNNSLTTTTRRHVHTEGDRELAKFLHSEISQEMELKKKVPKIDNFSMAMEGTMVTLNQTRKNETVAVSFDVNKSLIMPAYEHPEDDEGYHHHGDEGDDNGGDLISYPQFTVTITKSSGRTLLFNCSCNTGEDDHDDDDDGGQHMEHDDDEEELLNINSVHAYDANEMDPSKVYESETDNMDGELYSLLVNTLAERGVTEDFVTELIGLSTAVEHGHYVAFLKNLNKFAKD